MKTRPVLRSMILITISFFGIMGLWITTGVNSASAIDIPHISYAAKFVCGPMGRDLDVVKGEYATAVNIHNPQMIPINFHKKAVIALSERSGKRGPISVIHTEVLLPDEAMFVDCIDIRKHLFANVSLPRHIEGFVVIMVPVNPDAPDISELDVWAKYTARHRNNAAGNSDVTTDVESIEIEQVQGRRILYPPAVP